MADFCNQCAKDLFGEDFGDLAGITSKEDEDKNMYCIVICEGCGFTQVDHEGNCVCPGCLKGHGGTEDDSK